MDTDTNKAQEQNQASETTAERSKESKLKTASKAAKPKSKSTRKRARKNRQTDEARKTRTARPFPAASFEDSLVIALAMQQLGGDKRVRRITIFEHLKKSPDSGTSRQMVTNSGAYGVTSGGYQADYIELTDDGMIATDPEAATGDQFKSRLKLAIQNVEHFGLLYEKYAGLKLPATAVLRDYLREHSVEDEWLDECVALFIVNCKFVGVLRDIAGAERLLKADHAFEEATMSHRNPNVFYEMALRHAARLPLVQLIRKADKLPFDNGQVRSVIVDTTDIYSLVPKLQVYTSEIQTQARRALEDPGAVGNPITVFYPDYFG